MAVESGTPRRTIEPDPLAYLAGILSELLGRVESPSLRNASVSGDGALTVLDTTGAVVARFGLLQGSVPGAYGIEVLIGGTWRRVGARLSGPTSARPATPSIGDDYLDTTLGKPVWCKTSSPVVWIDATGATV